MDMTSSIEVVRECLAADRDGKRLAQGRLAFAVVLEAYEALAQMLSGAIDRQHDAELALSALRHPSETVDALRDTLRKLADLEGEDGEPLSPAFEQVLDELIAEVRLEVAVSPQSRPQLVSAGGHGRAM